MPAAEAACLVASATRLRLGVAVCYDLEYPEVTRSLALQGAELLVAPTALDAIAFTQRCLPARAIENAVRRGRRALSACAARDGPPQRPEQQRGYPARPERSHLCRG